MVTLRRDANGNFSARKRLPKDVQEEYGRRYGQRLEAKFFFPAGKDAAEAKQKFRDWETEVDGRITAIRAERTGEGVALTREQARALAGEWYAWFIAKHPLGDVDTWEGLRDRVQDALREAAGDDVWERREPDELWHEDAELRKAVRPLLADIGETAQFLALKRQTLNREAQASVLDWLYEDLAASLTDKRSASTVRKNWITASKTVFGWAVEHKHIPRNPFAQVRITVPKKHRLRETQAFLPDEWRVILRAALAITKVETPDDAAKRWVPWLCADTGARPGEITQLRGRDVIERDGVHGLRITPEAGTVKNKKARVVPIHDHLIEQGFLKFVEHNGDGPMFYRAPLGKPEYTDPLKAKKPRYAQARQRLADWVRDLGVTDRELLPNHAWRHTVKQIADRVGISERMSDYITGHAHKTAGAGYGAPILNDMAEALKKFPRYEV